jgi:hypothetical protein
LMGLPRDRTPLGCCDRSPTFQPLTSCRVCQAKLVTLDRGAMQAAQPDFLIPMGVFVFGGPSRAPCVRGSPHAATPRLT